MTCREQATAQRPRRGAEGAQREGSQVGGRRASRGMPIISCTSDTLIMSLDLIMSGLTRLTTSLTL